MKICPAACVAGVLAAAVLLPVAALAQSADVAQSVTMSAAQLFQLADSARDTGDYETAETAYRSLAQNPDVELRTEARFRLAMMLADMLGRHRDAAVLFRQILDEKPDVARVRVELARMQVMLGNISEAQREFRAAQAAGLPPEVEQLVRFYASALGARSPIGGSFQIALAPDTNINRATASDILETVIGDFDLSEDAQATSGIGLALRGQGYVRQAIGGGSDLLLRANGSARVYRDSDFNDFIGSLQFGPQMSLGSDQMTLALVVSHRWYGGQATSLGVGTTGNFQHPMGKRSRLTIDAAAIRTDDLLNRLRDAGRYSLAAGVDHAFSARFGGGLRLSADREVSRDPGYSSTSLDTQVYLFREFGQTTMVASVSYGHLAADERLFLYPEKRVDDSFEVGLSATFRALRVGSFSPLASVRFEDNSSTVGLYKYQRFAAELGITAAF